MKIFKAAFLFAGMLTGTSAMVLAQPEAAGKAKKEVLTYVEQMPEFRGNIGEYLSQQIKFPNEARLAGASGRVIIKFVVNETGAVTEALVEKGVHPALDAEALRVVQSMPNWTPGKQDGKPVKVYFRVPIRFTLEDPEDSTVVQTPVNTDLLVPELPVAFADEMPRFDGQLSSYLQKQLKEFSKGQKGSGKGMVSVTFVVEADGRITGAKVSKGVNPVLDTEALRIVNTMPPWIAGRQSGKPVAVYQSLSVTF